MICVILNEVKNLKSVSLCIQILRIAQNDTTGDIIQKLLHQSKSLNWKRLHAHSRNRRCGECPD